MEIIYVKFFCNMHFSEFFISVPLEKEHLTINNCLTDVLICLF